MTSWFESRPQQIELASTDMSQAIRDRIGNICALIERGYNLPQAESAAREVMESLRAMNSRLSRKEQQLNQVLEILLNDVNLTNEETAGDEMDVLPRKTLS